MKQSTLTLLLLSVLATDAKPINRADVVSCMQEAGVPLVLSSSTTFAQTIKPFNLRLPYTPIAAASPTTLAHVQSAIACGSKYDLKVSAKSGGHSYASGGLGGENGHLMIDMKFMNNVTVDSATNIATVQPGARLGNVALALYKQKRAISHGTCPGVGAGGHVLGGGYGYSSHTRGLAADALVEAEVVLADGKVVKASKTDNSDLFWAIRGAGPSFGVVTSMKFQTFVAPENNTVFSYSFGWNQAQARTAFEAYATYGNTSMPAEMSLRLSISGGFGFMSSTITGVYFGSQADFAAAFKPFLDKVTKPTSSTVRTLSWMDTLKEYAYSDLATPIDYDVHETFFAKSLYTGGKTPLTSAAMDAFVNYWYQTAAKISGRSWYVEIDVHGGPTSAVAKFGADESAYSHRDELLKYQFYDRVWSGTYPSNGFSFLDGWVDSIRKTMSSTQFGMYYNYPDPTLSQAEANTVYWGAHRARLSSIKSVYDPKNTFASPLGVLPK